MQEFIHQFYCIKSKATMNMVQKNFCKPAWNCHIFMVCQRANLHKLETHDVDENIKTNKDFPLLGRMLKSVPHAHACCRYLLSPSMLCQAQRLCSCCGATQFSNPKSPTTRISVQQFARAYGKENIRDTVLILWVDSVCRDMYWSCGYTTLIKSLF